jgi:hypothetical protein
MALTPRISPKAAVAVVIVVLAGLNVVDILVGGVGLGDALSAEDQAFEAPGITTG